MHSTFVWRALAATTMVVTGVLMPSLGFSVDLPARETPSGTTGALPVVPDTGRTAAAEPASGRQPARLDTLPQTGGEIWALAGGALFLIIMGYLLFRGGPPGRS